MTIVFYVFCFSAKKQKEKEKQAEEKHLRKAIDLFRFLSSKLWKQIEKQSNGGYFRLENKLNINSGHKNY